MERQEIIDSLKKRIGENYTMELWNGEDYDIETGFVVEDGVMRHTTIGETVMETWEDGDTDVLGNVLECLTETEQPMTRETFKNGLVGIRTFSEDCLKEIKRIVGLQEGEELELPNGCSAVYLLIVDRFDDTMIEEKRIIELSLNVDGSLIIMTSDGMAHGECDTAYPDIIYPYLLEVVHEVLDYREKCKFALKGQKVFTLVCEWIIRDYDGTKTLVFNTREKALDEMKRQYKQQIEETPELDVREIDDKRARLYLEGRYDSNHITWTLTENEVE